MENISFRPKIEFQAKQSTKFLKNKNLKIKILKLILHISYKKHIIAVNCNAKNLIKSSLTFKFINFLKLKLLFFLLKCPLLLIYNPCYFICNLINLKFTFKRTIKKFEFRYCFNIVAKRFNTTKNSSLLFSEFENSVFFSQRQFILAETFHLSSNQSSSHFSRCLLSSSFLPPQEKRDRVN